VVSRRWFGEANLASLVDEGQYSVVADLCEFFAKRAIDAYCLGEVP
jgi:hypothetical protein